MSRIRLVSMLLLPLVCVVVRSAKQSSNCRQCPMFTIIDALRPLMLLHLFYLVTYFILMSGVSGSQRVGQGLSQMPGMIIQ